MGWYESTVKVGVFVGKCASELKCVYVRIYLEMSMCGAMIRAFEGRCATV